jgi:hypothetical protein
MGDLEVLRGAKNKCYHLCTCSRPRANCGWARLPPPLLTISRLSVSLPHSVLQQQQAVALCGGFSAVLTSGACGGDGAGGADGAGDEGVSGRLSCDDQSLFAAALSGNGRRVQTLLDRGADPCKPSKTGAIPMLAVSGVTLPRRSKTL